MSKKTILVVEDDNIIGMEIRDRVQTLGYSVPEVISYGEQAIDKARKYVPDLILMDIQLRGSIDGIQAAEAIRQELDVPVIYLTAYADDNTLARAKITEPFGYVLKPFEERDLASTIEMALYKHQIDKKLKQNERWLSTTLKSIGEGVIATDVDGRITFMNPIAENLTGWQEDNASEKRLNEVFKLYNETTDHYVQDLFNKVKRDRRLEISEELWLESQNGKRRPILYTASQIMDDKGRTSGYVVVFQDNTERKKAQKTLARQSRFNEFRARLWELAADKALSEEDMIQKMLDLLGPAIGAHRVSYNKLFGSYLQESEYKCILEWNDSRASNTLKTALPAKIVNHFVKNKMIVVTMDSALAMLPPMLRGVAKPIIKKFQKEADLESILVAPFYMNNELEAVISLDSCRSLPQKPRWDDETKSIVSEAIDIIANFIYQKRNEEARRESEERFRAIFESAPDSIFIKDRFLAYTNINPAMEKLFKLPTNELIGLTDEELYGPEIGSITQQEDLRVLKGEVINNEITLPVAKSKRTFNVVKAPMYDYKGDIVGICGIARDVTDRKRATETQNVMHEIADAVNETKDLREFFKSVQKSLGRVIDTKNFYIALYNAANHSFALPYHADEKDRFTEIPAGKTMTAYVMRKKKSILVTEEEVKALAEKGEIDIVGALPRVWLGVPLLSGKNVIGVIAMQNYQSKSVYTKEQVTFLEFVSGQIASAIERKKAEEDRNRLATAIQYTADGIVVTDENAKILYVNPAYEKITGYSAEELTGKNPKILKSGVHDKAFYRNLWETLTAGKIWKGRFTNRRKSGSNYEEEATISPIYDENGNIINYVAVKRDVTEQLNLQARLKQAEKMEAIGTLAGGIAHDFNNIIAAIIGYAELSQDDVQDERINHNLAQILKASQRAKDLVQQILAFSRRSDEQRRPLQVALIVKEAMKLLRATIPATIDIKTTIENARSYILADPTQIHQLMMNLCTNAAHAMREKGGTLEVHLRDVEMDEESVKQYQELKTGSYVKLMVKDTGLGIDPQIIDRIFEPYFTTKGVGDGAGMGLALVHSIVKSYRGEIVVYSEKGKGTTFNIFLPRIEGPVREEREEKKKLPRGTENILYVDDEKNIVSVSSQILHRLGYEVSMATSGERALAIFEKDPQEFDLVITDQTMPKMTGAELAKKILAIRPDMPIILCTGFSEVVSKEKAKQMGIAEFLMKPLFSEDLANIVRKVLDSYQKN
ncbi:MAG: PAS domain S-box protein [Calditrichaeota bacterium]|nr:PAS domain S-box protein [Calditrichota bacterium]